MQADDNIASLLNIDVRPQKYLKMQIGQQKVKPLSINKLYHEVYGHQSTPLQLQVCWVNIIAVSKSSQHRNNFKHDGFKLKSISIYYTLPDGQMGQLNITADPQFIKKTITITVNRFRAQTQLH